VVRDITPEVLSPAGLKRLRGVMSLRPGDIISTGRPAGVAHGMKPPRHLQPRDVVEMGITGLGTQKSRVVGR
jgi:2-keto-4-pentenoate hydratase/2-oxohepta-3-ene-1,7-dioic acid hydratase in catechol pathway